MFKFLLTSIVFLFLLIDIYPQLSQEKALVEIKGRKPGTLGPLYSPGFKKEIIRSSTYLNGNLYLGTSANGHIYRVNQDLDAVDYDYGAVGDPSNTIGGVFDRKRILSLTNDGTYIFGATTDTPFLFYLDPNASNPTPVTFGYSTFKADKIASFNDVAWHVTPYSKTLYFATENSAGSTIKIVKWNVWNSWNQNDNEEGNNPTPSQQFEILDINYPERQILDIEIGKNQLGNDVLYIGVPGKILILPIGSVNYDDVPLPGSEFKIKNFKADPEIPGVIWLFGTDIVRWNLGGAEPQVLSTGNTSESAYDYLFYDGNIYTEEARINISTFPDPSAIKHYEGGFFHNRNINTDGIRIFSAYSWRDGPIYIHQLYLDDPTLEVTLTVDEGLPDPFTTTTIKEPTGGDAIKGLAIDNKNIISGIYHSGLELGHNNARNFWAISNISENCSPPNSVVQADKILIHEYEGQYWIIYGLYASPYLRVVNLYNPNEVYCKDLSYLYLDSMTEDQARVSDMIITDNENLIIGTASNSGNSHPRLISIKFADLISECNDINSCAKVIGIMDAGGRILSLTYRSFGDYLDRIYGTVDNNRFFIYNYDIEALPTGPEQIITKYDYPYLPTSVLHYNDYIFLAICNSLLRIPQAELQSTMDLDYGNPAYDEYSNYFRRGCNVGPRPWIKQLSVGNDGKIYCYTNGYLHSFNYYDPLTTHESWNVPGYVDYTSGGYAVSQLGVDATNVSNNEVYVGTYLGRLYRLTDDLPHKQAINNSSISRYSLDNNFPNPFNPYTEIKYSIKYEGKVSLKIFDILGRLVMTIVNEYKEAGTYSISFDASNLPSGIYIYKITSGDFVDSKKMILLK